MKRLSLCLVCLALLLTGCASRAAAQREAFAEALRARQDLSFTAALRLEYPDRTVRVHLSFVEKEAGYELRVLEPEEIGGVRLLLDGDGAQLRFEDITLDAGSLDRYGLSPVTALPTLVRALREAHLEHAWTEGDTTVWELAADDTLTVQVWLDEALVPCRAELIRDGSTEIFVDISDWR